MDDENVVDSEQELLDSQMDSLGADLDAGALEDDGVASSQAELDEVNSQPMPVNSQTNSQPYQPNGNAWNRFRKNDKYRMDEQPKTPQEQQKQAENDSSAKAGGMAARGAADVATGGAYEKVRNAPVIGKAAQAAEKHVGKKVGNAANALTRGKAGRVAKKADDSGALDAADKAANAMGGNPNPSIGNQFAQKNNPQAAGNTQTGTPVTKGNRPMPTASSSSSQGGEETAENTTKPKVGSLLPKNPFQKGKGEVDKEKKEGTMNNGDKLMKKAIKGAIKFFLANPIFIIPILVLSLFVAIIFFIAVFIGIRSDSSSDNNEEVTAQAGSGCNYDVKTNLGNSFNLSGITVELINCDGSKSNYRVLETVDFEKYVLGVALAEAGPDSPDEAIKAQIIAARNFALTRSGGSDTGMCPGNYNSCFYGYNSTSGVVRMRACEADQVYWDYTKDIYRQDRGSISLYSPEVNSGSLWKSALSSSRQAEVEQLAAAVKGETLVDGSGNLVETNYKADITDGFISRAKQGMSYKEILEAQYGSGNTNSAQCDDGSAGTGDYNTSSDGNGILHEPLSSFLSSKGSSVEEYNNTIKSNVEKAGYGTRAGVVAAATTLIGELGNKYSLKFPYFWGGGHEGYMTSYASSDWGSTKCHTYANNQNYNYCGLDCSGFVSWAIYNGGYNVSSMLAGTFDNLNGAQRVSLSNSPVLKPGDLLDHTGHVILVIGVDEANGVYKCAEAGGNAKGVLFSTRPFNLAGYWGVNMDGFYNNQANVR